jgi:23S rRNA pseudouridine1911/1915/1917 synthase
LVVLKPAGLLTQGPPGIDSMTLRIREFLIERENKPGGAYVGVPHRLDRPVSGAMVFTKHVRAARRLSKQFERRQVRKVYWACVAGQVEPTEGTWRDTMRKVPGEARAEIVPPDHPDAQTAILRYRVLGNFPWGTWLEIELETGRTHQIRVQAAQRGHPILGDALYGSEAPFGEQFEDVRLRAIALHGRELGFEHPMTREAVSITAPLPRAWRELGLGLSEDHVD